MMDMSFFKRRVNILLLLALFAVISCEHTSHSGVLTKTGDVNSTMWSVPKPERYIDKKQHSYSLSGKDFDPDISPDGMRIVFASTRQSSAPHLFIKHINGSAVTQLTGGHASDVSPVFSPDGRSIAFSSNRNGNWDIFVINVDNSKTVWQVTATPQDEVYPSWSPDSSKLAYSAMSVKGEWEIWVYDIRLNSFTNIGPGVKPKWSPVDNSVLMFQRIKPSEEVSTGIWLIRTDGTALTEVVSNDHWSAVDPAWSRDGKYISFSAVYKKMDSSSATRRRGDDIWIVGANGEGFFQVTDSADAEWSPVWDNSGRIYFVSDTEDRQNIWSVKPAIPAALVVR